MTRQKMNHEFVEFIPEKLQDHTLYISIEYDTVSHKCACGCGHEVVTPLSPRDWKLVYNGEAVSLHPSIGNWSFDCRSHYWIKGGDIVWAEAWSKEQIEAGRRHDRALKGINITSQKPQETKSIWKKIKGFWSL